MAIRQPKYSKEEFAARGDALYQQTVRPQVEADHFGEVVAIDIDSGAFEVGENMLAACEALLARVPDAQVWCVRVGSPAVHRCRRHDPRLRRLRREAPLGRPTPDGRGGSR